MKQVIQTKDRSTKERFNSLSKEELSHIGWLSYLSEMPTSNLIIPDPLPQVESDIILDYVCEEGLSEPEPKNDGKCSVRQLTEELNSASKISFKYHSIPIVDLATRAKQKSLAFPYTEDKPFKYIKIKNIKINNRTFPDISETCFINFFVYTSYPITETIFCEVPINSPKFARYQHQSNTVTLPFPPDSNPEPILVLLLFKFDEFQLANGRPHVVGRMPLSGDPSKIKIDWYNYQHGKTICEIFETEKLEYADSKIDFEFLDEFSPDDSCRFTSFDPMYPSPLLTLHNIRIKFQHCLFPKKARAFISFSLKKNFADPKCQDPRGINAFILPTSKEPNEIGYSSIIEYADEIVLPEPINFILDPSILESITLTIDVNIIEKGKTTNVLTSNIQISKPIEEHVNKMESKGFNVKAALSRGDNILKMTSIYPTLVCPPPNIRGAFSLEEFKIDDPMIKSIAPYVINQRIRTDSLPVTDIKALFMFFRYSDMSGLQSWIEHFFTPEPGFSHAFASYVTQNLLEISDWPQPIFLLLFKSMCYEKNFIEEPLYALFEAIAKIKNETIIKSASDFLLQLQKAFDDEKAHKISYYFISLLSTKERFFVFSYIFSDISYVKSLALKEMKEIKKPFSPYVPLLSLFYRTVTNAFMENDSNLIKATADSLSILASTLEQYTQPKEAQIIAKILFPLFSSIYTFYDSLSAHLEKKHKLVPILLFLFKNCDGNMFYTYFKMLSKDNQIGLIDFLMIIYEITTSSDFSNDTIYQQDLTPKLSQVNIKSLQKIIQLNCIHESTWRILMFLRLFDEFNEIDDTILNALLGLLIHILNSPKHSSDTVSILYKMFAYFVEKSKNSFFVKETKFINDLVNAIFPMTQMKLLQSRVGSVSLLNWLINTETKINKSCSRCEISFQLSLCETIFKNSGFIPFWSPDYPVKLSNIYNNISKSLCNQITYERTVEDLLKLYQEFQNFPSIRASIYQKIVSINEENDDYCAAFVTQWKLCALIAEVFKLKGIKVGGIPTEGISAFMYVNNEPVIDITVYPKTSSYLVMESKLFNEDSMSESLQKAMELCIKAKINWIIGDITVFLFDFLEKRRQFALLKKLFNKISTVYADLQKSEETQIQFARITLNKTLANKLKFNDVIHCYPKGEFDAFVNKWKQNFNNTIKYDVHILSDHNVIPWESDTKQTNDPFDQQIIQVNEDHNQLLKLEANTFTRDVMMKAENWNDPILTRYTFETENVLPGCSSLSKVKSITKKEISKEDYYEERLTEFRDKLKEISENYRAVVPTGKSTQVWGQYILGISNTPLLKLMSYVFNAEQEDDNAYYWLVYQYHIGEIDVEPPLKIAKLCDEIWQILIETIPLMQAISKINAFSKSEQDQFDEFRKRLGITIVSLE